MDLCSDLLKIGRVAGNPKINPVRPLLLQYKRCPSELLPRIVELTCTYNQVVVVARGYSTLQRFRKGDRFKGIEVLALACVAANSGSLRELKLALALFAEWISEKLAMQVTRTGPHCPVAVESKLAWRKFVHQCLKFMVGAGAGNLDLTWTKWAAVAKDIIRRLPDQPFVLPEISEEIDALRKLNLRSPAGQGNKPLSIRFDQGVDQQSSVDSLRYETIHQIKGETHDATVVVSSLKRSVYLSHWQDWLANPTSEGGRFAYVASSRPRHLLIWAVKTLKPAETDTLTALGFELA